MKILILRFSSIGDIVLTTPVIRCVKKHFPNAELHFCTKKAYVSLLENNPYLDEIIPLEDSLRALVKTLNQTRYDHVIDLHHNLRTSIIKAFLPQITEVKSFQKLNLKKILAVKLKWKKALPKVHIVDRYMDTVKHLGVENDGEGLDYFFPDGFNGQELPSGFSSYIALVIGAQFATKQLPVSKLISLCQHLPEQNFVIIGGKEDFDRGEEVANACTNVLNTCGQYSFHGSAYLVKNAQVVVSNDTGLMHIAAAFDKKIISVWGNTIPEFGMYPYLPQKPENFSMHQVENLSCRPCSKIGYKACPKGHFKCMEEQNIEQISGKLQEFLS